MTLYVNCFVPSVFCTQFIQAIPVRRNVCSLTVIVSSVAF